MPKRILDVVYAGILLLVTFPLFPFIAFAVWATSEGPVLLRQRRIGKGGVPFTILKFRTLRPMTEFAGRVEHSDDDRITATGKILRPTHLDELPQLINVLRGDMSMVGPRPLMEMLVAERTKTICGYEKRAAVRPGITGFVQVLGRKEAIRRGPRRCLYLDLFYIKRQGFCFDLVILLRTVLAVVKCDGI